MERDSLSSSPHIAIFDGLRGLAILLVVAVHANMLFRAPAPYDGVLQQGMFGVQIFFAVSAATLMLASRRRNRLDLLPFAVRRLARIAPLYWLGVLFYVSFHILDDQHRDPLGILFNLLFVHGFVPKAQNTIVPGGWSIGCEMAFYVLFPFLFRLITNLPRALGAFVLACALDVALLQVGRARGWRMLPAEGLYYHPAFQLPVFIAGIAVYHATKDRLPAVGTRRWAMHTLAVLSLVGIVRVGQVAPAHASVWAGELIPIALLVGTLVYACVSAPPRLLTNAMMVRLGLISFSMYIWHFAVLFGFLHNRDWIINHRGGVPFLLGFLLTLVLSWPLAEISRCFIELPGIQWGRVLLERLQPSRPTGDATG